jgi:hypothetical protein
LADLTEATEGETTVPEAVSFSEDDDLELCLYYLQSLSNVLSTCGDAAWAVLASKHVSVAGNRMHISSEFGSMCSREFSDTI